MADRSNRQAEMSVWGPDNKQITSTTDAAKERLDVKATIEGGSFQLTPFIPVTNFNSTGVALNDSTWTTLLSQTSEQGKLDFIACSSGASTYMIRLTVDGSVVFSVSMSDLSAIGLSNAINVPIWAETADKNFRYHPKEGVDYTDSLLIEAKAVTGTPTLKYLITHRDSKI